MKPERARLEVVGGLKEAPHPYRVVHGGLARDRAGELLPLANFTATIVAERLEDDGVDCHRLFELEARRGNGTVHHFEVAASEFPSLTWVVRQLGSGATVYAGQGTKDHARAAIQLLSGEVEERHTFTHTGWRLLKKSWAYLHAAGAVDGENVQPEVTLRPPLDGFELPTRVPSDLELRDSVKETLRTLLQLAPLPVIVPILGAVLAVSSRLLRFRSLAHRPDGSF